MRISFWAITLILFSSCIPEESHYPVCYTDIFRISNQNSDTLKIFGFREIDNALLCAKERKCNLLILFSGWALMSRYNQEWEPLQLFDNTDFIKNNYVVSWLAVDDRHALSQNKNENFKTIGALNMALQFKLTNTSTQPLYCIVDTNMNLIGKTLPYTKDKQEIKKFFLQGAVK